MTDFGLGLTRVRDALSPVLAPESADSVSDEELSEVFARVAWSTIAEPGDGVAGAVIAVAGPARSLAALLSDAPRETLADMLSDACDGEIPLTAQALTAAVKRWRPRIRSERVFHALTLAQHVACRLIVPDDERWPASLSDLGIHAPLVLWCRGSLAASPLRRSIALVGARAATGYGEHVAMEASASLSDRAIDVVSGAAYGIDGACHRAALASGGNTVAFLAGGLDRFYPAGHSDLLERIVGDGAVLAEVPCGTAPSKWRFLQRNRLIAAAARATVVVEAGWRSGSLNTAGHAASLARPLGAVPGPVTSPSSAGCHRLIREFDATCVTSARDMAELIEGVEEPQNDGASERRDSAEVRTLDALSTRSPRSVADIAERSGQSVGAVAAALGILGLQGEARETEGGWLTVPRRE